MEKKQNSLIITSKKRKEIISSLNNFYQNPVAKVSFELFLTIGLVLFLAFFAIKPTILTMSELIKEIENKEKLEQQLTQKIASLQTAQTELLTVEDLLPVLDEAIPSDPEVIRSAKIIEKMATDTKVVIRNLSLVEIPNVSNQEIAFSQKTRQNLSFSVNIFGDYISIRNFVEALKDSRKSFIVDSVTFSLQQKRQEKELGATIAIHIPYFGTEQMKEQ